MRWGHDHEGEEGKHASDMEVLTSDKTLFSSEVRMPSPIGNHLVYRDRLCEVIEVS